MQIFVKTLAGETLAFEVAADATVESVKAMLEEATGLSADELRLVFAGIQLEDGSLADFGVQKESTLQVVLRLRGGKGKKKKKKQFAGAKKVKGKRKKVAMRVLRYYKVDADGKIEPTNAHCPKATCDKSVLLANHKDRRSCGKCGSVFDL